MSTNFLGTFHILFAALLLLPLFTHARCIGKLHSHDGQQAKESRNKVPSLETEFKWVNPRRPTSTHKRADPLQITGSSLPDCTHACGSCTPCRLVMVSFVCSSLEEAETCPMAYKCMCHNKSYPVP